MDPMTWPRRTARCMLLAGTACGNWGLAAQAQEETFTLDQIVVTASGGATDLRDAPASVTVVTEEDIARTPATDVADVLSRVEGVSINRTGNQETVQIRGLPERYTLFLVDGKRVNSDPNLFRGNAFDSGWVPLDAIERIEVVRGPMSSLYGSDAIGGVINIITKPVSDEWHGSLTADYTLAQDRDAGDAWSTGFFVTGPIVDDTLGFKLYGNISHRDASDDDYNPVPEGGGDPWPGFSEQNDRFLHGTVSWAPNASNTVDLDLGYEEQEEGDFPLNRFDYGLTHYGDYEFGTTEFRLYGDRIENEYGHGNVAGVDQPNTAYNRGAEGRVVLPIDGSLPQTLTLGAQYLYQQIDDDYVLTGNGNSSVWQTALYFEDEIAIGNDFLLTLGTRVDNHEKFGDYWSPRVYGVYHLTGALTVKGGWAQAFKAPTLLENSSNWDQISCGGGCFLRGDDDLQPETGDNYEVGVVYDQGPFGLTATLFRNDLDDVIQFPPARTSDPVEAATYSNFVGFTADGLPVFTFENIDSARTQGLEAAASYEVTEAVTLRANYTYLDGRNTSGGLDIPLAYNPEHSGHVAVEWQASDALFTSLTINYVGEQYTYVPPTGEMENAVEAAAYTTADLMASYDLGANFTAQAGILNVFDETIERDLADDFNLEGRRFYVSLTGRF